MNQLRLLFWGSDPIVSVPVLRSLATWPEVTVCGVITQPDRPVGRGLTNATPLVKNVAEEHKLLVLQPETLHAAFRDRIASLSADVAVVVGYGRIIPESLLTLPEHGTLNVHPSLLPLYRGPTPVQAAILDGATETGVSIIVLDALMDHGPVLAQESTPLAGTETTPMLEAVLAERGATLLKAVLLDYVRGTRTPHAQDHARATFCAMIRRDSGKIDWQAQSAQHIERMSRAYTPWPGIWCIWSDGLTTRRVKFFDVGLESHKVPPGSMRFHDQRLQVGTATTVITFSEIQLEGKKRMPIADVLRGMPEFLRGRLQ